MAKCNQLTLLPFKGLKVLGQNLSSTIIESNPSQLCALLDSATKDLAQLNQKQVGSLFGWRC